MFEVQFFVFGLLSFAKIAKFAKISTRKNYKNYPQGNTCNITQQHVNGQLALLMQTRDIDLREVITYLVGPYPWSYCGPMGELC